MEELGIDKGIRELINQLWKHDYETLDSCEGHNSEAYVLVSGGDGWFEENCHKYGLAKVQNNSCCVKEFEDELIKLGYNPEDFIDKRKVCDCGAGVNKYSAYRGKLVQISKS